ncbi:MAG: DUF2332 family protein [Sneathiella sp.]
MTETTLEAAFRIQSKACANLDSPFMERFCALLADNLPHEGPVWKKIRDWEGDVSPYGDSVPLRLAGAFHGLARTGRIPELNAVYPPHDGKASDQAVLNAVEAVAAKEAEYILARLESAPQTNEVRRAGVLLPGFFEVAHRTGLSELVTSELGASAGLNLYWDHFRYKLGDLTWGDGSSDVVLEPDIQGQLPAAAELTVRARAACDLNPVDIHQREEREKLLSYLWPDQMARIKKTEAAISFAARQSEKIVQSDAIDWLSKRLAEQHEGAVHVVYHTIAWQYFPEEKQKSGEALLKEAGSRATKTSPLAWLRLEADQDKPGAALSLTVWPEGETRILARGDFHGRWIKWM